MLKKRIFEILAEITLHCILTFLLAALIYSKTESVFYAVIFIFAGIFVDLDHLIDYFLYAKKKFRLDEFLRCFQLKSGRVYIFLHSWELAFGALVAGMFSNSNALLIFAAGLGIHLAIDNIQRQNRLFYFLIYRFYKKFDVRILLPEYKINV